jgi:putative acetyltransferase
VNSAAQIRPATDADRGAIRGVVLDAFGPGEEAVGDLVEALRAFPGTQPIELVAEREGALVGHVMLTRSLLDAPRRLVDVSVLSPLSVVTDRQGQGIGTGLVRAAIEGAAASGSPLLFLEGDPAYYVRHGFVPGGPLGFRKPSLRIPDAAFQVVVLPSHEPWMTGTLVYAWPFWALDCVGLRDPDV